MYEYKCYTKQGSWKFYADNDTDALRLALFYSWRDGEDFIKVESSFGGYFARIDVRCTPIKYDCAGYSQKILNERAVEDVL